MIFEKLGTVIEAFAAGRYVSTEIREEREQTCRTCDKLRKDRFRHYFCGMCGCSVSGKHNRVLNLTAHEECLPSWGCKHPARKRGTAGWKR